MPRRLVARLVLVAAVLAGMELAGTGDWNGSSDDGAGVPARATCRVGTAS